MRYAPSEAELACMAHMDAAERLHYFITRSMECEEVWSLRNTDGCWAIREGTDGPHLPLWPYRILAEACLSKGEAADAVSLEHFVYHELGELNLDGIKLEIMPGESPGMVLSASELFQIFDRKIDDEQYFIEG